MSIPSDYRGFLELEPDAIEALGAELIQRPLSAANFDDWLRDWANLGVLFQESFARLDIAVWVNTADEAAQAALNAYRQTIWPIGEKMGQALEKRLSEHEAFLPSMLAQRIAQMKRDEALNQSDEALALQNQDYELMNRYGAMMGAQSIEWEGQTLNERQARRMLNSQKAVVREKAWRALRQRLKQDRESVSEIWGNLLRLRQELAEKNGFANYLEFRWREMGREDYSPEQSRTLHHAFLEHWSPLYSSLMAKKQAALGLSAIKPWDIDAPMFGQALKPFDDGADLIAKVSRIFHRLDPEFGADYDNLVRGDLLDIAMRDNTAPVGGFARAVGRSGVFVMLNVAGRRVDAENLIHEMGHALSIIACCKQPYHFTWGFAYDFSETPSSVMELLSMPYWDEFYQGAALSQAKQEYFMQLVESSLHDVMLEAFQFWAYSHLEEASDPTNCEAKWLELHVRYLPNVDWQALGDEVAIGWQRLSSLFYTPMFAMEYSYGRLVGFNLLKMERAEAVRLYKQAIALGTSRTVKETFAALGTRFFFNGEDVASAAKQVQGYLMA